ncbi:MAG: DUF4905 domain-containing protein [Bacteroidetes bacterium]|nr:DUF4905 domain-containing protein [Bacteroidota bacterium]
MPLFKRTSPHPWQPLWRHDAGAMLWSVKFSGDGRILGEVRDLEARQANYFCCDEHDGHLWWSGLHAEHAWWVGIEDIDAGRFYLHGFRKPDMPQHLGIYAYNLDSAAPLWRNEQYAFLFAFDGEVYASQDRFDGRHVVHLSPEDGSVVEELGTDNERVHAMRMELNTRDPFAGYRYPEHFDQAHSAYAMLREQVHSVVDPASVRGQLDVLCENDLLLLSWHETTKEEGTLLQQVFHAMNLRDDRTLFRDTIVESARAPAIDSFFIKDTTLYYVKNYRILTAHDINGVPA